MFLALTLVKILRLAFLFQQNQRGVGADVSGYEIGVTGQPVAGTLEPDRDSVMKQPIKRCGDDGIAQDLAPFRKAAT